MLVTSFELRELLCNECHGNALKQSVVLHLVDRALDKFDESGVHRYWAKGDIIDGWLVACQKSPVITYESSCLSKLCP